MDKPKTTPKDFFLWAGAMASLYVSVFALVALIFDYINYAWPDPLSYLPTDPYQGGIAYEMALFIVLGPLCVLLMRLIHRDIERDPSRDDIWVRRWALYLVLFIAGATVAVDLITLLYTFLSGDEITLRFLLKALIVFLVASAGFMHFLADLRGYWTANPAKSKMVSIGVGVLGLIAIVAGFFIVGTPQQARLYRFDEQKTQDLQTVQYQVVYYYQKKQSLPASLSDLNDPIANYTAPSDPQSGQPYAYRPTGKLSFELCAMFNAASRPGQALTTQPEPASLGGSKGGSQDNWQHDAGRVCFERTIDPELYPPLKNQ